MLFAAKPQPQPKHKSSNTPQIDCFLSDFASNITKNLGLSLNKLIKQKHGRKFVQKQSKQAHKCNISHNVPLKTSQKWQGQERKMGNSRPNFTIYEHHRNTKIKRHTYNNQCYSSERQDQTENQATVSRDTKIKRTHIAPQAARTQETVKRTVIQKRAFQDRKQENLDNRDLQQFQGDFLKPKSRTRKYSIHNKLLPIQFNENIAKKPSLVDLIKKFKFQNLKTTNITSPNSQDFPEQEQEKKFNESPVRQGRKDFLYFRQKNATYYNDYQKKLSKKASRDLIKSKRKSREQTGQNASIKKMNSFLSPWGTITDQYILLQSPIE